MFYSHIESTLALATSDKKIAKARLAVLAEIHDLEQRLQEKRFATETSENNDEVLTSYQINE